MSRARADAAARRVHDMGGRAGCGPVAPGPDARVFAEDWHARALAVTLAAGALGQWTLDMSRRAREDLAPRDYMAFGYYEKWLAGLADLLVERGVLSRGDLRAGEAAVAGRHPLAGRAASAADVAASLARGAPASRPDGPAPAFGPGDAVRARHPRDYAPVAGGHTRLPAYARGARGRVLRCHGSHVLPDTNAHGLGEAPEPLYSVAFAAGELWPAPDHPADEVILDLWQRYLAPA